MFLILSLAWCVCVCVCKIYMHIYFTEEKIFTVKSHIQVGIASSMQCVFPRYIPQCCSIHMKHTWGQGKPGLGRFLTKGQLNAGRRVILGAGPQRLFLKETHPCDLFLQKAPQALAAAQ